MQNKTRVIVTDKARAIRQLDKAQRVDMQAEIAFLETVEMLDCEVDYLLQLIKEMNS